MKALRCSATTLAPSALSPGRERTGASDSSPNALALLSRVSVLLPRKRSASSLLLLLALVAVAGACKPKQPAADESPVLDSPMARDLDRICNAEEQSGALDKPPSDRAIHVGIWLATNLESQEARDLSAALSSMAAPERGKRLQEEVSKYKFTQCEILHAWGQSLH